MIRNLALGSIVLCLCAGFFIAYLKHPDVQQFEYQFVQKGEVRGYALNLAFVDTPIDMQRGLSGHRQLAETEGLLFVFESDGYHGIWMKDMLFPIDVVWLDANFTIVSIRNNFLPDSYPEVALPQAPARYVLEVAAGTANTAQMKIGDRLEIKKLAGKDGFR